MANLQGFPNSQALLTEPPFTFATLVVSDLASDAFTGMPIGTQIVVTDFDTTGKGCYAIKTSTYYYGPGDWMALGGTYIDAGQLLNNY